MTPLLDLCARTAESDAMAVPISSDPEAPFVDRRRASTLGLQKLGAYADQTGRSIVNLSAFLQQIDADAGAQLDVVTTIAGQASALTRITREMTQGLETVASANARALKTVDGSLDALKHSASRSRQVATWVGDLEGVLATVEGTLAQVNRANHKIAVIAKQVNILAVNARIEAARAGDSGRGFAVVAEAINALSKETAGAASDVTGATQTLQTSIRDLRSDAQDMATSAHDVLKGSANADRALTQISENVRAAAADTQTLTASAMGVTDAVEQFAPAFDGLTSALSATAKGVHNANARAEEIVDISESAVQLSVELGADNADTVLIEIAQDRAAQISALFETAIASGQITANALFSSTYTPIRGSQPQQVKALFTNFTDRVLPAVQEPTLTLHPRIVFCAAIDRNGYLPTHNRAFSAPQSPDPIWNAAHCRNRRIFNDRVGLKSGKSTAPFLMQTYRRDMGGEHVLMKDVSAPIVVQGRHWGGFRMGLKLND